MSSLFNIFIGLANVLMVLTSLFLICLVLIQRGKGGGLAGAFGGVGGSSAFGTKAGDVFTRVTIYVAIFWFVLAMILVYSSNSQAPSSAFTSGGDSGVSDDPTKTDRGTDGADLAPPAVPTRPEPVEPTPSEPANPAKAAIEPTSPAPTPAPVTPKTP